MLFLVAIALSACGSNPSARLDSPANIDLSAKQPQKITNRGQSAPPNLGRRGTYQLFPGSGNELGEGQVDPPPGVGQAEDGKFTVNVDQASIGEAAKLILGETLGFNYVVDPRVQGTITLSSSRPLTSRELMNAFESTLRFNGAALLQSEGVMKIVALQEVLDGEMGSADLTKGKVTPGYGVSVVPLRYVSPATMMELMESFIARSGSVRGSTIGNLILIRGSAEERRSLVDVVLSFDLDWMKNQSASIAILANARAEEVATKLNAIFAEDSASSGRNAIKVIPLERLNGIVVIANSQQKVRRALSWVKRLDQESTTDTNYYVYAVQNGNAAELSKILVSTFIDASDAAGPTSEVAPDKATVDVSTQQQGMDQQQSADQNNPDETKTDRQDATELGTTTPATTEDTQKQTLVPGIRITPNPANNTIVIRATAEEYRKILNTLHQIDAPATQVLINTTIAEVVLNNDLRYGVQAYFNNNDVGGGVFTGNTITLRPSFPGLNFFLGSAGDPKVVIDALSAVTKVRIVSSPSILVLENETATIKVGDQVPIQTQTLIPDNGPPISSFEYRDTGVILKVKPRVNANGMVTIELGQELSSVSATTTSGAGDNPTFSQRSITSKVSVNDAQTVLLGGLISGREGQSKDSVPGVNKIPLLGDVLGRTENTARRTELIVFITPQIIRNGDDASRQSQDLRDRMKTLNWD
jgi:general secretion pathway protein D